MRNVTWNNTIAKPTKLKSPSLVASLLGLLGGVDSFKFRVWSFSAINDDVIRGASRSSDILLF